MDPAATTPAIDVNQVSFNYAKLQVIDGLSLQIPRGVSFGLLGPNGAGKTTLIRLIVGLLQPHRGQINILGRKPARQSAGIIGYMPQLPSLYAELSVQQNVGFFAAIYSLTDRKKRMARVEDAIKLVELWDRRGDSVQNLSGGMKQRVSLACAIAHDPPILLLDEPTVGLDPELRCVFWDYFSNLTRQGRTLIISSHTMDDASHCDLLAFMRQGKVIATGTPTELKKATGKADATLEDAFLFCIRRDAGAARV
jgi:ABC-2 type transport system ATP-binding protein